MEILYIVLLSLASIVVLFLLTKLMGNKQISQLTTFDYIVGITIGSIAAEMSTNLEDGFARPVTAMAVYGVTAAVLSVLTNKFIPLRRLVDGRTLLLMENGKLFKKNFKKAKLSINEFLTECRLQGYANIADVQTAMMEPNGRISVIPKSVSRPPTARELNLEPPESKPPVAVIIDGEIMKRNLKFTGNNEAWLHKELKNQGIKSLNDVFYASCDKNNSLSVYTNLREKPDNDMFS